MATASLTLCPRCGGVVDAPIGVSLGGRQLCGCSKARKSRVAMAGAAAASGKSGTFAGIKSPAGAAPTPTASAAATASTGSGTVDVYARELTKTGGEKVCCVCGKDVTRERRMKDGATGRYWCYECGSKQPQHVQHAMDVPCPECGRRVPAMRLIKFHERYLCATCHARHAGGGAGKKLPVLFVIGILLLAVVLYGLFTMHLL